MWLTAALPEFYQFRFSLDLACGGVLTNHVAPPNECESVWLLLFLCASRFLIANSLENNTASPARTAVTSRIPRESVASKGIASIGYSKRLHILEIEFVNGAVYRYLEVAPSVYRDLMSADSKARYYDRNIKGNYPSVRVRPRVKQETD